MNIEDLEIFDKREIDEEIDSFVQRMQYLCYAIVLGELLCSLPPSAFMQKDCD